MKVDKKKLDKGRLELTIEVPVAEIQPFVDRAAIRLAQTHSIPGFRPGKAPLNIVKSKVGEMKIYEEALQELITKTYWQALKEQKIDSVGKPEISIEKLAPGNPITYKAIAAIMPEVSLTDWKKIHIARQTVTVTDSEVDKVIEDLRSSQASEALVTRAAQQGDKVEINFEVRQNNAVIEGGKGAKYPLILGSDAMIPGFEEQLVGLSALEKKDFTLTFPKPYFQKNLEGKEAQVSVELLAVYGRTLPEKNDAWTNKAFNKTYKEFRNVVHGNLMHEKENRERQRLEQEVIGKLIEKGSFQDVPELMQTAEIDKMIIEMQEDIRARGMDWDKYMESIKKTKEQLRADLAPNAEKRVQGALILRALTKELAISVGDTEIDAELTKQREAYKDNKTALANISTKEYRRYLGISLTNRLVMDKLLSTLVT